jgi:hypothetical protein
MRLTSIYRFIYLLLFLTSTTTICAQDDDTTIVQIAPPVEEYDDEDDYNSSRYQQTPPALRKVSDSVVDRLKRDEDFAYANDPSYLKTEKVEKKPRSGFWDGFNNFFKGKNVKTITYILLIAFFIFVVYRIILVNKLYLFYSSRKTRTDGELEEENLSDENLDDRISNAINAKDYRSAVRFLYLKGLHLLNEKGWIRYHAQATNHDYVYQLSQKPVSGDFRFLTQVYDYVWYGEFAVNDDQFSRLHSDFKRFYQAVR